MFPSLAANFFFLPKARHPVVSNLGSNLLLGVSVCGGHWPHCPVLPASISTRYHVEKVGSKLYGYRRGVEGWMMMDTRNQQNCRDDWISVHFGSCLGNRGISQCRVNGGIVVLIRQMGEEAG